MAGSSFKTNPYSLEELLKNCHSGFLQLPDFQRGWVWDEERIKSLLASVAQAFPMGALMSLETGGPVNFKPRAIEGAPKVAEQVTPHLLLLDGQQRMTSLYQATMRDEPVDTETIKKKKVRRWFYIDMEKALGSNAEDALIAVPENRIITRDFGREVVLDLSSAEKEYAQKIFPLSKVFDWFDWGTEFNEYWSHRDQSASDLFKQFRKQIIENFQSYQVPVITLDRETKKEAVCIVFEKVNTGGKQLDAFELVTAIYAASGHLLRKDWWGKDGKTGRHQRFVDAYRIAGSDGGAIAEVSNTDFLQAIALFHTRELRREAEAAGKQRNELPLVIGNRQVPLNLPLEAYRQYQSQVEDGFMRAAKFLHMLHIFRVFDLPYQSQVVPLAAILADIGDKWDHEANRRKLEQWYWCGVFGELYGSTVETRIANDFLQVPKWLESGEEPATVRDAIFRAERLKTMRIRLSAAYKGVNALLMNAQAKDLLSGQKFEDAVFFDEHVDIHHIFPQQWCKNHGLAPRIYDSIINKTPLSGRTNRKIGGSAPSNYLAKLEKGDHAIPPIERERLDEFLDSHLIDPALLRADDFEGFMDARQQRLKELIEKAMGKSAYTGGVSDDSDYSEDDEDSLEAQKTIAA